MLIMTNTSCVLRGIFMKFVFVKEKI